MVITCPRCQKKYHLDPQSIEYSYSTEHECQGIYWACHQCDYQWWQSKTDLLQQHHHDPSALSVVHEHLPSVNDENGEYGAAFDVKIDLHALKKHSPIPSDPGAFSTKEKSKNHTRMGQRMISSSDYFLPLHSEEPLRPSLRKGLEDGLMERHPLDPPQRMISGPMNAAFYPFGNRRDHAHRPWQGTDEEEHQKMEKAPLGLRRGKSFVKLIIVLGLIVGTIWAGVTFFRVSFKGVDQGDKHYDTSQSSPPSKMVENNAPIPKEKEYPNKKTTLSNEQSFHHSMSGEEAQTNIAPNVHNVEQSSSVSSDNHKPKEESPSAHPSTTLDPTTPSHPPASADDMSGEKPFVDDEPFPPKDLEIDPKKVHYVESDGEGNKKNITVTGQVYNPNPFTVQLPKLQFVVWAKCHAQQKPNPTTGLCVVKKWAYAWSKKDIEGSGSIDFRTQNDIDKKEADGKIRVDVEID